MKNDEPRKGKLWAPRPDNELLVGDALNAVVEAYSVYLEIRHKEHHQQFQKRLSADPDAAKAEAALFSWLRNRGLNPNLSDSPGAGGIDYLCLPDSRKPFFLEVTHLDTRAVERESGWPDELSRQGGSFSMITPRLWSKVLHKAPQLSNHEYSRVLAVCLRHVAASVFLGTLAAEWFMTSRPHIQVPIAGASRKTKSRNVTDLRKAAFFEIRKNGAVVLVRKSISAVLLVSVWEDQLGILGSLHPKPVVPFDYRIFDDIPFLRVQWPIKNRTIRMEWLIGNPNPAQWYYRKVIPTREELTGK